MRDDNKFQICQAAKYSDKLEMLPADVENQRDWLSMQQGRFRLDIRRNCLPMMIVNYWLCWEAVNLHQQRFSRIG